MIKNIPQTNIPENLPKKRTRVIRMVKSQKSKTYSFEEKIVLVDYINKFFQKKYK